MAGLYPDIDVYTAQLRKLEAFVTANPKSTAGRFVLAYHYLTQGNIDAAVSPAQAGCGPGPPGHTLRPARQAVLAARDGTRHPGGSDRSATRRRRPPSRGIWPETGPPTRPAIRRSTCTSGTTRPSPGRSPPRASPGSSPGNGRSPTTCSRWLRKETRGAGRPRLVASRRQVDLSRHRDGARGSRVSSSPTEKAASSGSERGTGRMRSGSPPPDSQHFRC